MDSTIAGVIAALIGFLGVGLGASLQSRRDARQWLRDQKLRAASEFLTSSGQLFEHRHRTVDNPRSAAERDELGRRVQAGRSTIQLLCDSATVDVVDQLARRVYGIAPGADDQREATVELLRKVTDCLRSEVGAHRLARAGGRPESTAQS